MDNTNSNESLMLYLDGELQGAAKLEFEKKLAAEPALAEELQRLGRAKDAVRLFGLKEQVAAVHSSMMEEFSSQQKPQGAAPVRRMIRYSLAVAASIIIIFITVKSYQSYTLTPDRLFKEQYASFELSSVRGNESNATGIEKAYREKKYSELMAMAAKSDSLAAKELFLTGMAQLETGDFTSAIATMKKLSTADTGSIFKDASEYYLGLAYIKTRNYEQALPLLQSIHDNPAHLYHDRVPARLIEQVNKLKSR